ncbi:hypothetical protein HY57_02870 [Dyella japonica A8]|uniref:Uncharacterized protein n=1 Tax=Dyella japonica A8 TaxID=1217721 RepID=A0A075JXR4_9GAMM|nr:hypothetical protein HY57_02870 [Dyella japonica A8]
MGGTRLRGCPAQPAGAQDVFQPHAAQQLRADPVGDAVDDLCAVPEEPAVGAVRAGLLNGLSAAFAMPAPAKA